ERIQMLPSILFAGEHDSVVGGPMNHPSARVFGHVGKRILEVAPAAPHLLRVERTRIRNPYRPGTRPIRFNEVSFGRISRLRWPANKSELFFIGRPLGSGIAVHRRRYEANAFLGKIVDADETVVTAL